MLRKSAMSRTREMFGDGIDAPKLMREEKREGSLVECLYTPHLYGILSRHADLKRLLKRS